MKREVSLAADLAHDLDSADHGELNGDAGMPRNGDMFWSYDVLTDHAQGESPMSRHNRLAVMTAASLFALSLGVGSVLAAGEPDPKPQSPAPQKSGSEPKAKSGQKKKKEQKSEREYLDGYRAAYAMVQSGQYDAAFAAFKALDADDHPDVANYLGYTARKLGQYDLSQVWYERALEADPKHVRTWQYYGMWHVEQGNRLKAADFLEQIRVICGGTDCKEYQDLKGGMEGTVSY